MSVAQCLARIKQKHLSEGVFFVAYLLVLGFVFGGMLISSEILPGWDTVGHYTAIRESIHNLTEGRFFSYSFSWFGGAPLVSLYPPLSFIVLAVISLVTGIDTPMFLLAFRWFVFFCFAFFPVPFYLFLKEFFDQRTASWGVWLSFWWVFYPKLISSIGVGAGGALFYGLFGQTLSTYFLLWYLIMLHKVLVGPIVRWRNAVGVAVPLALIILSHTVTTIVAFVATVSLMAFHWRKLWNERHRWYVLCIAGVAGVFLAAFWLVPYVQHLPLTSGERIDAKEFLKSPLFAIFPFDWTKIVREGFTAIQWGWALFAGLFLMGVREAAKSRKAELLALLAIMMALFGAEYLTNLLPGAVLHYYRFYAFTFLLALALGTLGLKKLIDAVRPRRIARWATFAVGMVCMTHLIAASWNFGVGTLDRVNDRRVSGIPHDLPYYWNFERYPSVSSGRRIIDILRSDNLPEQVQRILPDMPPVTTMSQLGSMHFVNSLIPLVNEQPVLFGLYAESSPQLPFLFPLMNRVSDNNILWGRVRDLEYNAYFRSQPTETMFERLRLFGVNYAISASDAFSRTIETASGTARLAHSGPFSLFHLSGARPLMYAPDATPGLYLDVDGSLPFRSVALGWFSVPELLPYHLAAWPKSIEALTSYDAAPFSYLVVGLSRPNGALLEKLQSIGKPLIVLNSGVTSVVKEGAQELMDFRPVAGTYKGSDDFTQPNIEALQAFSEFVRVHAKPLATRANPQITSWTNHAITARGSGPLIVNLGYFPYWNSDQGTVFPVTPYQMLVFANGSVSLDYRADAFATWAWAVTILTGVACVIMMYFTRIRLNISSALTRGRSFLKLKR